MIRTLVLAAGLGGCSLLVSSPEGGCPESISAGSGGCLVTTAGALYCWGPQATAGTDSRVDELRPVRVSELSDVHDVSMGEFHACAVHGADRRVSCWGVNNRGQVGDGTTTQRTRPTEVIGLSQIAIVRTGSTHSCALDDDGALWCWGGNEFGQLGDGTTEDRREPTLVTGPGGASAIAVGDEFSCAIAAGDVYCWGTNADGEIGDGTTEPTRAVPTPTNAFTRAVVVSAGCHQHVCAIDNRTAWCWGNNVRSQLGSSTAETNRPSQLTGRFLDVAAGAFHTCAINDTNGVVCWGDNTFGQVGQPADSEPHAPEAIEAFAGGESPVVEIETACSSACARQQDGTILCWGSNAEGQLGDGTRISRSVPMPIDFDVACQ